MLIQILGVDPFDNIWFTVRNNVVQKRVFRCLFTETNHDGQYVSKICFSSEAYNILTELEFFFFHFCGDRKNVTIPAHLYIIREILGNIFFDHEALCTICICALKSNVISYTKTPIVIRFFF